MSSTRRFSSDQEISRPSPFSPPSSTTAARWAWRGSAASSAIGAPMCRSGACSAYAETGCHAGAAVRGCSAVPKVVFSQSATREATSASSQDQVGGLLEAVHVSVGDPLDQVPQEAVGEGDVPRAPGEQGGDVQLGDAAGYLLEGGPGGVVRRGRDVGDELVDAAAAGSAAIRAR